MIASVPLIDQKQNCTRTNVAGSFCYNGPRHDPLGQIKSTRVPGTLALTFNDGPGEYTNGILDVLDSYGWKGTFFILGRTIAARAAIVQRMLNTGHQVCVQWMGHGLMQRHAFTGMCVADMYKHLIGKEGSWGQCWAGGCGW